MPIHAPFSSRKTMRPCPGPPCRRSAAIGDIHAEDRRLELVLAWLTRRPLADLAERPGGALVIDLAGTHAPDA